MKIQHQEIKNAVATAKGIGALLFPFAEIVVHDLARNKIAYIENNFSRRKVGDSSALERFEKDTKEDVIGPYEKVNWNSRRIKSTTTVIRNNSGKAVALLCINLDVEDISVVQQTISTFIGGISSQSQPEILFRDDWQEKINQSVKNQLNEDGRRLDALSARDKKQIVKKLNSQGAFAGKRAAEYVAGILKISRATVYNYLGN